MKEVKSKNDGHQPKNEGYLSLSLFYEPLRRIWRLLCLCERFRHLIPQTNEMLRVFGLI